MAAQRPSVGVGVARASLTLGAALGLARVFGDTAWAGALAVGALVPPLIWAFCEKRRWPSLATVSAATVIGAWLAIVVDDPSETAAGIPTTSALANLGHDLANAPHILRTAVVPVEPQGPALVLAFVAVFAAAFLTEVLARRLEAPVGAIGPSIALYVAIAALGSGRWEPVTACYALVVMAYLVSLQHADLTTRRTWFQSHRHRRSQAVRGGIATGALVIAFAIAAGPAFPGARGRAWLNYRSLGKGNGSDLLSTADPLTSVADKLNITNANKEVFTVASKRQTYWRVAGEGQFEDGHWTIAENGSSLSKLPGPRNLPGGEVLHQTFRLVAADPVWLPAAYRPLRTTAPNAGVLLDSATLYVGKNAPANLTYDIDSEIFLPTKAQLETVRFDELREAPRGQRNLPDNFPASIRELAARETAGATGPYQKAAMLEDFFQRRGGFVYDTTVNLGTSEHALERFLLTVKRGFCEQFATSFAEMARSLGLPARVAIGYQSGTLERDGLWHVRNRDAHAWPEVWLGNDIGWYAFEPTKSIFNHATRRGDPAAEQPSSSTGTTPTTTSTGTTTRGSTVTSTPTPRSQNRELTPPTKGSRSSTGRRVFAGIAVTALAIALIVAGVVIALVARAMRRTRRRRHDPDARRRVLGAFAEAIERLAAAGVERRPSATAIEFALRQAPAHGAGAAGPPLMDLARLHTAAMFGPQPPSDDDAQVAWERVDAIVDALRTTLTRSERWITRIRPSRRRARGRA
jgi:transglutaminase-like putative cysteine protease